MGLFNFFKNQFVELIEWTDTSSQTLVNPIIVANQSIKMGAELKVRESQVAVIVNEGKVADVFAPGKYTLSQDNLPILSTQRSWNFGHKSPFKVDVYYVNTKQFAALKWGTVNPLIMRTAEFGSILLKANGTYAFRVTNAEKFMKEIFGTNQIYETPYITGQLKSILMNELSAWLIETNILVTEIASQLDEISEYIENNLVDRFAAYGLELCSFIIDNVIAPDHVLKVEEVQVVEEGIEDSEEVIEIEEEEEVEEEDEAVDLVETKAHIEPIQIKCDECGNVVTSEMKYCPNCGVGVKLERPCRCGYYILNGVMRFCPNCGTKL